MMMLVNRLSFHIIKRFDFVSVQNHINIKWYKIKRTNEEKWSLVSIRKCRLLLLFFFFLYLYNHSTCIMLALLHSHENHNQSHRYSLQLIRWLEIYNADYYLISLNLFIHFFCLLRSFIVCTHFIAPPNSSSYIHFSIENQFRPNFVRTSASNESFFFLLL